MLKPTYVIASCLGILIAVGIGVLINQSLIQV
jgi:hypothetical protein